MPTCPTCEKEFPTMKGVSWHHFKAHGSALKYAEPKKAASSRFLPITCPHCHKPCEEDLNYRDLQVFLCPHCAHQSTHGLHTDYGPGALTAEIEMGHADTRDEARYGMLLDRGWKPPAGLALTYPDLGRALSKRGLPVV